VEVTFPVARDASDELRELRDELGSRLLKNLENRANAQLRDAHLGEDLDDVVELAVGKGDELVFREPVAVEVLLELRPPASLVFHQGGLAEVPLIVALGKDLPKQHPGEHAVAYAPSGNRIDHPCGIADQSHTIAARFIHCRRGRIALTNNIDTP